MNRAVFWLVLFTVIPILAWASESSFPIAERVWTNDEGKRITARALRVDGNHVVFEISGSEVPYPVARLVEADQDLLKAAAEGGTGIAKSAQSEEEVVEWVRSMRGSTQGNPVSHVYLDRKVISDEDLARLKVLTNLKELSLVAAPISDAGMEHLKDITTLQQLTISSTKVTNEGILKLGKLTKLRLILCVDTGVNREGAEALKKILPHCTVSH